MSRTIYAAIPISTQLFLEGHNPTTQPNRLFNYYQNPSDAYNATKAAMHHTTNTHDAICVVGFEENKLHLAHNKQVTNNEYQPVGQATVLPKGFSQAFVVCLGLFQNPEQAIHAMTASVNNPESMSKQLPATFNVLHGDWDIVRQQIHELIRQHEQLFTSRPTPADKIIPVQSLLLNDALANTSKSISFSKEDVDALHKMIDFGFQGSSAKTVQERLEDAMRYVELSIKQTSLTEQQMEAFVFAAQQFFYDSAEKLPLHQTDNAVQYFNLRSVSLPDDIVSEVFGDFSEQLLNVNVNKSWEYGYAEAMTQTVEQYMKKHETDISSDAHEALQCIYKREQNWLAEQDFEQDFIERHSGDSMRPDSAYSIDVKEQNEDSLVDTEQPENDEEMYEDFDYDSYDY